MTACTRVMYIRSATAMDAAYILPPPITNISLQSVSSAAAIDASRVLATFTLSLWGSQSFFLLMTKLNRPGSGLPARASKVLRPITTGIPQVVFLKNLISLGKCQTNWLSFPITLLVLAATMRLMIIDYKSKEISLALYCHFRLDCRMALIVLQDEIPEPEPEDILYFRIELHDRQGIGRPGQL